MGKLDQKAWKKCEHYEEEKQANATIKETEVGEKIAIRASLGMHIETWLCFKNLGRQFHFLNNILSYS
jgi:hypothetical protein